MTYAMREAHYQRMYDWEERFWWFVGIRSVSEALLRSHLSPGQKLTILDTGCGTGANIQWLEKLDRRAPVTGLDYSYHALKFCRERGLDSLCQGSATDLPFRSNSFDLVTSFDLLPHIPRGELSARMFDEYHRVLKSGGLLFLRGPAYGWLRSSHDEDLNATNRYTARRLVRSLQRRPFTVERITYANTLAFPFALAARLAKKLGLGHGSDVRPLPGPLRWLETLFAFFLESEARYLARRRRRFYFGLSVFVVARK